MPFHYLLRGAVLEQVADRARFDGFEHMLIVAEDRPDNHLHMGHGALDTAGRFDAVQARHLDVHQHHLRLELQRELHSMLAVARDAHKVKARLVVRQLFERLLQARVIFRQKGAYPFHIAVSRRLMAVNRRLFAINRRLMAINRRLFAINRRLMAVNRRLFAINRRLFAVGCLFRRAVRSHDGFCALLHRHAGNHRRALPRRALDG
jgi:hypothetical protein